jgi:acetyltransferase-like isoleucine patch superfamily enzyme
MHKNGLPINVLDKGGHTTGGFMGKQNRLLRKLEKLRANPNVATLLDGRNVVVSREKYGTGRFVRKLDAIRARRNEAPFAGAPRVSVGRHTYGTPNIPAFAGSEATVEIGSFCSIAANVTLLLGGGHNPEWVSTWPIREVFGLPEQYEHHPVYKGPTVIGNDVWLGRDALIFDGITIGDGAIIGARAVVTKDVRPYAIVGGVPAREIRRRFTDEQVEALLEIAWWDWPEEKILREASGLNGANINDFLARHSRSWAERRAEPVAA